MTRQLTIGQKIVHRRYGAGTVVKVRKGGEGDEHDRYYVIDIPSRDLKVHLPVDSAKKVELRRLSSMRKMKRALRILTEEPSDLPSDYRERRALVTQLMTEGTVRSLAQIIRDLCGRKRTKNMSTLESTMLTNAKRQFAGELALVAAIDLDDAMQRIEEALLRDEAG
jgi:CarD family transcriptional regulator